MIVKNVDLGTLYTNCYVVGCAETREALIIDPRFEGNEETERILREVNHTIYRLSTL